MIARVTVSGMMGDVFMDMDSDPEKMVEMLARVEEILGLEVYDGLALDSAFLTPNVNHKLPFSIKNIVGAFRKLTAARGKLLFIGLEGTDDPGERMVNKKVARTLAKMVDRVLLNCYEYPKSVSGRISPLSPWDWLQENLQLYREIMQDEALFKQKVVVVLPLFGRFTSLIGKLTSIRGDEMLPKLAEEKSNWMEWDSNDHECAIAQNKYEYIMYPCLNFFKDRYQELERLGLGVALLDAGSGLDIFMEQL
jgi:hypothetical protein